MDGLKAEEDLVAEPVRFKRETDVFVLMRRYGESYWAASSTHETAKQAEDAARATPLEGTDTWSIVKVCRLPVVVPSGEA